MHKRLRDGHRRLGKRLGRTIRRFRVAAGQLEFLNQRTRVSTPGSGSAGGGRSGRYRMMAKGVNLGPGPGGQLGLEPGAHGAISAAILVQERLGQIQEDLGRNAGRQRNATKRRGKGRRRGVAAYPPAKSIGIDLVLRQRRKRRIDMREEVPFHALAEARSVVRRILLRLEPGAFRGAFWGLLSCRRRGDRGSRGRSRSTSQYRSASRWRRGCQAVDCEVVGRCSRRRSGEAHGGNPRPTWSVGKHHTARRS